MVSPIIDEDLMMDALKPSEPEKLGENAKRLRFGASLLLLDAYDRKLTRDQFMAALGAAVSLVDMLGRFEMITSVKEHGRQNGKVTGADLEVALADCTKAVSMLTEQCTKMAQLVQQCPMTEDPVH